MESTAEERELWVHARSENERAARNDEQIDFYDYDDDEILTLCDEELLGDMNFIAEMSDDYSTTCSERGANGRLHRAAVEEAEARSLLD